MSDIFLALIFFSGVLTAEGGLLLVVFSRVPTGVAERKIHKLWSDISKAENMSSVASSLTEMLKIVDSNGLEALFQNYEDLKELETVVQKLSGNYPYIAKVFANIVGDNRPMYNKDASMSGVFALVCGLGTLLVVVVGVLSFR